MYGQAVPGLSRPRKDRAISSKAVEAADDMNIATMYEGLVGYVVMGFLDEDGWSRQPIGTFFLVKQDLGPGASDVWYAVTCRHVIEEFKRSNLPQKTMFVRANDAQGLAVDSPISVDEWIFGEGVDIAVTKWTHQRVGMSWAYPIERGQPFGFFHGQNVFFIGMFSLVPGFISVQPVVRTGTIARFLTQVPLCFVEDPEERIPCGVHLVEMRSWGGESGSPVFFYDDRFEPETPYAFDPGYGPGHEHRPGLMGVLHGQFEIEQSVTRGKKQVGSTQLNSGIGVVIPMGDIIRTLRMQVFVDDRRRMYEEQKLRSSASPRPD